jgi:hypothetical protein
MDDFIDALDASNFNSVQKTPLENKGWDTWDALDAIFGYLKTACARDTFLTERINLDSIVFSLLFLPSNCGKTVEFLPFSSLLLYLLHIQKHLNL